MCHLVKQANTLQCGRQMDKQLDRETDKQTNRKDEWTERGHRNDPMCHIA